MTQAWRALLLVWVMLTALVPYAPVCMRSAHDQHACCADHGGAAIAACCTAERPAIADLTKQSTALSGNTVRQVALAYMHDQREDQQALPQFKRHLSMPPILMPATILRT